MADTPDPTLESPPHEIRRTSSIPSLRQRQPSRAATFAEGTPSFRRRSSIFSTSSLEDTRQSLRSSTEDFLRPGNAQQLQHDDASHWHSIPLVFAVLPAVGGLLFNNGSAVVTDILLLGISTMILNWCVRVPWDWYTSAQHEKIVLSDPEDDISDTIFEEGDAGQEDLPANTTVDERPSASSPEPEHTPAPVLSEEQTSASAELRKREILALFACFLGPVLGAYLLHYIRSSLSRPSEGLVSNYNLTIFVLAAELRPVTHIIKLQRARILHLQRVVRSTGHSSEGLNTDDVQAIIKRLENVETRVSEQTQQHTSGDGRKEVSAKEVSATIRQSLQPQLDALNRAVRRYEKRYTTQIIQTEARLQDLELRLQDALSLAAAAARSGQRPGIVAKLLEWISGFFAFWLRGLWTVLIYPFHIIGDIFDTVKQVVMPSRTEKQMRKGKNNKASIGKPGSTNGHHLYTRHRSPQG